MRFPTSILPLLAAALSELEPTYRRKTVNVTKIQRKRHTLSVLFPSINVMYPFIVDLGGGCGR